MVQITVERDGDKRLLRMKGHANYKDKNDIVCAGCSAVGQALVGWCMNYSCHLTNIKLLDWQRGRITVDATGDDHFKAAFEVAVIGLEQIAAKYPAHVEVTDKGKLSKV